jgi:hypothetical protein
MMKHWRAWETEAAFEAWHTSVVDGMNLPRVGLNQATGEPEPNAQWTTRYTEATEIAAGDWRAPVDEDVAEAYPSGIGVVCDPPPEPDFP